MSITDITPNIQYMLRSISFISISLGPTEAADNELYRLGCENQYCDHQRSLGEEFEKHPAPYPVAAAVVRSRSICEFENSSDLKYPTAPGSIMFVRKPTAIVTVRIG